MGGMKVSNMDFIKLLPAFMQDDEAAIALSKAVNKLIGEQTSGHNPHMGQGERAHRGGVQRNGVGVGH